MTSARTLSTISGGAQQMVVSRDMEIRRLRAALKFYADPKSHPLKGSWSDGYPGGIVYVDHKGYTILDTGEIAKEALNEK